MVSMLMVVVQLVAGLGISMVARGVWSMGSYPIGRCGGRGGRFGGGQIVCQHRVRWRRGAV